MRDWCNEQGWGNPKGKALIILPSSLRSCLASLNQTLSLMFHSSLHLVIPWDTASSKLLHSASSTNTNKSITSEHTFYDEKHWLWLVCSKLTIYYKNYRCRATKPRACQTSYKAVTLEVLIFYVVAVSGDKKSSLDLFQTVCGGWSHRHTVLTSFVLEDVFPRKYLVQTVCKSTCGRLSVSVSYRFQGVMAW